MDDYIRREKALQFRLTANLRPEKLTAVQAVADAIAAYIKSIPAADVRPVKRGEWLPFRSQAAGNIQYCSSCGIGCPEKTYFCPHCGADMTGGTDR